MRSVLVYLLFIVAFGNLNAQDKDVISFLENIDDVNKKEQFTTNITNLKWHTDYQKALKIAKRSKKPLLVYFTGSDWCAPCKSLSEDFFTTAEFEKASIDYVLVYLDIPYREDIIPEDEKKANKATQKELKVSKFPTVLALDHNGKERNRVETYSYRDPRYYWEFMNKNKGLFF